MWKVVTMVDFVEIVKRWKWARDGWGKEKEKKMGFFELLKPLDSTLYVAQHPSGWL